MPLGIRPINDMAFKKTFGTPENKQCLISLLNAIVSRVSPIVDVTIQNPYNLKDFETDKLSILDVKAIDQAGVIYDIEMQLTIFTGLVQRIVFYGCELYSSQLKEGVHYNRLHPVYSICLVDGVIWKDAVPVHHRFQLCDRNTDRVISETLEIHTLELGRYTLTESDLKTASVLDCWLFWLLHAHEYETEELLKLFPDAAFQQATRAITQISLKTEDKAMYDAREKALRDYQSAISAALMEGVEKGRAEGELFGRAEGEALGRAEGEKRGALIGRIEVFQEILGLAPIGSEAFRDLSTSDLEELAMNLQKSVRDRATPSS